LYHGRALGRVVIGPYLPADICEVPKSLLTISPDLNPEEAQSRLAEMPRVRSETAERIASHMRHLFELVVFLGHRAHLSREMHVASVREGYRELAEKTAKLQNAYERLQELDRLKSNFLATVSHELRTPLTSILGYAEMLTMGIAGPLTEEQAEHVETIQSKGDHLLLLITNLLDLAKVEQSQLSLHKESIFPAPLLEEVAKTVV